MKKINLLLAFCFLSIIFSCQKEQQLLMPDQSAISDANAREPALTGFTSTPYASGLITPQGMALDDEGRIWVTEKGTGMNDGQVSVILPNGQTRIVYNGFASEIDPIEGQPSGLSHLIVRDDKLYILHGVQGKLFIVSIDNYKASNVPVAASTLMAEDLKPFVVSQNLTSDNNSNIYNLCFGKNGDLYIVDAGANAIIKRDKTTKALSIFAKIPGHPVPTNPFGIPFTDAVPTGIEWDGTNFIVSTLGGFPFPEGLSAVFKVSSYGTVTEYKNGFSTITDICLTPKNKPLLLQFSKFDNGFKPMTGKILDINKTVLMDNLMLPVSLIGDKEGRYYVLSTAFGTVTKLRAKMAIL